jgi:hypothetical protein
MPAVTLSEAAKVCAFIQAEAGKLANHVLSRDGIEPCEEGRLECLDRVFRGRCLGLLCRILRQRRLAERERADGQDERPSPLPHDASSPGDV